MTTQTEIARRRLNGGRIQRGWVYFMRHKGLYLMLLPTLIYYLIFHYLPLAGISIAFKDFHPLKGILNSPWVGTKYFDQLFKMAKFKDVVWNTLRISLIRLVFGFPFPIIISLLLNELRSQRAKRLIQSTIYLPEFISWVVLGGMLTTMLSTDGGVVNGLLGQFGIGPIAFLSSDKAFIPTMVVSMIWKTFGWNTIIYLAALTSIPSELYEAATIDGASRFQRMLYITLPGIKTVIVTILIIRIGSLMQAGFEQILVLYHPGVYRIADIIDTWVYRLGLQEGKFELATAVGLFKSVINFVLLIIANYFSRSVGERGVF